MQFSVHERFNGREVTTGKNKSCDLLFVILGTPEAGDNGRDLDADALAALTSAAATTLAVDGETLVRTKRHIEPLLRWDVDAAGQPAGTMIWDGSATYERFDYTPPEVGESSFSFDTGGGTQHITQSIATVASYPQGAPSFQGAIGVTHDSVEGVDITVPVYSFSETHYNSLAFVTESYKQTLFGLTGKVNNAAFKGFAAGEVLFLGASGSKRGDEDWEISYRFAASKNKTGLVVGSITGIDKKGWEYMWVRYADAEDANAIVKKPVAVYIEKVYDLGDFTGLGI